jgi:hypothetical protein
MPVLKELLPNGGHQLTIDGKPFLCRAGELQNSSLSSPAFMRGIWPRLVEGNINTVLGAVGWEDIEPEEGVFFFDDLDEVIEQAREYGVKLILLWFGSHKNGELTPDHSVADTQVICPTLPRGSKPMQNDSPERSLGRPECKKIK